MNQNWRTRFLWWLCDKADHPFPIRGWIYEGQYHRDCRWCKRIVSEPLRREEA